MCSVKSIAESIGNWGLVLCLRRIILAGVTNSRVEVLRVGWFNTRVSSRGVSSRRISRWRILRVLRVMWVLLHFIRLSRIWVGMLLLCCGIARRRFASFLLQKSRGRGLNIRVLSLRRICNWRCSWSLYILWPLWPPITEGYDNDNSTKGNDEHHNANDNASNHDTWKSSYACG